jgi:hypothetical protein
MMLAGRMMAAIPNAIAKKPISTSFHQLRGSVES